MEAVRPDHKDGVSSAPSTSASKAKTAAFNRPKGTITMRPRYVWYFVLGVFLALILGEGNVRGGGDFFPGFAAGLLGAAVLVAIIEAVRFLGRWAGR